MTEPCVTRPPLSRTGPLVAVDWGTTSLRGALIGSDGRVLAARSAARGILSIEPGGFPEVFSAHFGDWMAEPGAVALISGMAGSRQGWVEAPYCPCPARFEDLASAAIWIEPERIALVPGLSDEHAHAGSSVPDVMRGEEVQIVGAMAITGLRSGWFVLPGTHNKWARVQDGCITGFRSHMTGEFYALLASQSILSRTLDADPQAGWVESAFLQGVAQAANGAGLLHNAFGTRTLALFDRLPREAGASYLSGVLIGEELRAQQPAWADGGDLVLVGSPTLTSRYAVALAAHGVAARTLDAEATWAGLHALAAIVFGPEDRTDRSPPVRSPAPSPIIEPRIKPKP
ncbi:MAG: 2-dehydro-3-deoxygalactonokinase [Comamonadaceae bacterium]|nr:MAG: 2-dehydro-3-deoxygalactonokinase [Comamonadaceae bacterium]